MDQWLASLPKNLLAFSALALGIGFIVLSDPPRGLCDTQIDQFKTRQQGFLYLGKKQKKIVDPTTGEKRKTEFEVSLQACRRSVGPGGCLELFLKLKDLKRDVDEVSRECQAPLSELGAVHKSIWSTLDVLVRLAWGEKAPEGSFAKTGWFAATELNLFCTYKKVAKQFYGSEAWTSKREKWMTSLPEAAKLGRGKVWDRILLSVDCSKY